MKIYFTSLLIVISLALALASVQGFTCPTGDDCLKTGCLYLNRDNCNKFWQCDLSGRAFLKNCPAGLEFNDFIKVCDWPSSQTCRAADQLPAVPTSSSTTRLTTKLSTTSPSTTRISTSPTTPKQSSNPSTVSTTTEEKTKKPTEKTTKASTQAPTEKPTESSSEETTEGKTERTTQNITESTTEKQTQGPTKGSTSTQGSTAISTKKPTPLPSCDNEDDAAEDADLDLNALCSNGCSSKRLIPNPNSEQRYIICNGGQNNNKNSINKCSQGLLFDSNKMTCDYAGLVNSNGPSNKRK